MRERPELASGNVWAWEAYRRCQGGRALGMVAGDISLQELEAYCRLWRIEDRDDIEELHDYFMAMDGELRKLGKSSTAENRSDDNPQQAAGGNSQGNVNSSPKSGKEVFKREAPATV